MLDIQIVYGPPPSGGIVIGTVPLDDGSATNINEATTQAKPAKMPK